MQKIRDFPSVVASTQVQTLWVDFGKFLPAGIMLSGTPTVTVAVDPYSAVSDPAPMSHISQGPALGTAPAAVGGTGEANTAIFFQISDLLPNVLYMISYSCARNDGSDIVAAFNHIFAQAPI